MITVETIKELIDKKGSIYELDFNGNINKRDFTNDKVKYTVQDKTVYQVLESGRMISLVPLYKLENCFETEMAALQQKNEPSLMPKADIAHLINELHSETLESLRVIKDYPIISQVVYDLYFRWDKILEKYNFDVDKYLEKSSKS